MNKWWRATSSMVVAPKEAWECLGVTVEALLGEFKELSTSKLLPHWYWKLRGVNELKPG
jgi:hypothetical protein